MHKYFVLIISTLVLGNTNLCAESQTYYPLYIKIIQEKAKAGDPDSMGILGDMQIDLKNIATAAKLTEQSAQKGSPIGKYSYGCLLFGGLGVQQDQSNGSQMVNESLEGLNQLAEKGNLYAECCLGWIFTGGQAGVPQNVKRGTEWLEKAAKENFAFAQYSLALQYKQGLGVLQDEKKSNELMEKAAHQSYPLALIVQADDLYQWCNSDPSGVSEEDIVKGKINDIELYSKVSKQLKDPEIPLKIAKLIVGMEADTRWLTDKPEFGIDIESRLLEWNQKKKKYEELLLSAVDWCKKSAQYGNIDLQLAIAQAYSEEKDSSIDSLETILRVSDIKIPLQKNSEESSKYYNMAADNGSAIGDYKLGECYYKGLGVNENREKAIEWWSKAIVDGSKSGADNQDAYCARQAESILGNLGEISALNAAKKKADNIQIQATETAKAADQKQQQQQAESNQNSMNEITKKVIAITQDEESEKYGGPSTAVVLQLTGLSVCGAIYESINIKHGTPLKSVLSAEIPMGTDLYPVKYKASKDGMEVTQIFDFYKDSFGDWKAVKEDQ